MVWNSIMPIAIPLLIRSQQYLVRPLTSANCRTILDSGSCEEASKFRKSRLPSVVVVVRRQYPSGRKGNSCQRWNFRRSCTVYNKRWKTLSTRRLSELNDVGTVNGYYQFRPLHMIRHVSQASSQNVEIVIPSTQLIGEKTIGSW